LSQALASRSRSTRSAVLFLDLDGFKTDNDSLGHASGDRLLTIVAGRLTDAIRPGDTVARLGGDEFAVLLDDVADVAGAEVAAERLLDALRDPIEIDGRRIAARASLGIAMADADSSTPTELLRNADAAMYRTKAQRRGGAVVFEPGIHADAVARFDLESELRGAVSRGELHLVYQPIIGFGNGRVSGAEALARWTHPVRGSIPPSVFVPIAEESDLVLELGAWVLEQACRQAVDWLRDGVVEPDFVMSVNVSARQLTEVLPGALAALLDRTGLPPENLTIEVTESAVMSDAAAAIDALTMIRRLGVSVAMDDFGTGYSSLAHLRSLPIDTVKIDRSFVEAVDRPFEAALVRSVVELARVLWLRTVAEGVETEAQAAALAELGCDFGQGYLFGRPVAAGDFEPRRARSGVVAA
jgi:diguanylate cyclase (GGDEF)-like protein